MYIMKGRREKEEEEKDGSVWKVRKWNRRRVECAENILFGKVVRVDRSPEESGLHGPTKVKCIFRLHLFSLFLFEQAIHSQVSYLYQPCIFDT